MSGLPDVDPRSSGQREWVRRWLTAWAAAHPRNRELSAYARIAEALLEDALADRQ